VGSCEAEKSFEYGVGSRGYLHSVGSLSLDYGVKVVIHAKRGIECCIESHFRAWMQNLCQLNRIPVDDACRELSVRNQQDASHAQPYSFTLTSSQRLRHCMGAAK